MTIDRAIEILDPEHRENYDGMDEVNEACRMGMGEEVLAYSPSRGMVADYYDRGIFGYADVTHWMPLPEPPEEGENENAAD